jgi:hypothetical protein
LKSSYDPSGPEINDLVTSVEAFSRQTLNDNFLFSEEGWFTCKHIGYQAMIHRMWEVFKVEECVLGSEDKKNQLIIWKKIVRVG